MKAFGLLVVYSLVALVRLSADPPRIRPLDPLAAATFDAGTQQSNTFRSLVDALQGSDLVVHAVTRRDLPSQLAGATRFVTDCGGVAPRAGRAGRVALTQVPGVGARP